MTCRWEIWVRVNRIRADISAMQLHAAAVLLLLSSGPTAVYAHEVRPAYLELRELDAGLVEITWKQPILPSGDPTLALRLPLEPQLPSHCVEASRALPDVTDTVLLERWTVSCGDEGLAGARVEIVGLARTLTDVLLRVRWADGNATDHLLRPDGPFVILAASAAGLAVPAYLELGVEHLLFGFDHILFVVGLMCFVRRPIQLVQVVTSFTVAHSITLALSTLGVMTLSQGPVEAVIALSILFLAVELSRGADPSSPMSRWPWSIAFGFGLLHGFGFAGALSEIGLPGDARVTALFLFNVGVEVGQLLVVGGLLSLLWLIRRIPVDLPPLTTQLPVYLMGTVSAYWFIDRVAGLL